MKEIIKEVKEVKEKNFKFEENEDYPFFIDNNFHEKPLLVKLFEEKSHNDKVSLIEKNLDLEK